MQSVRSLTLAEHLCSSGWGALLTRETRRQGPPSEGLDRWRMNTSTLIFTYLSSKHGLTSLLTTIDVSTSFTWRTLYTISIYTLSSGSQSWSSGPPVLHFLDVSLPQHTWFKWMVLNRLLQSWITTRSFELLYTPIQHRVPKLFSQLRRLRMKSVTR